LEVDMQPSPRFLSLPVAVLMLAALVVTPVIAHGPDNPFDSTSFANIDDEKGMAIGLQRVAEGFTAPVKGARAPGDSARLYVVDQAGKLWAVNLADGSKVVMLDVTSRLTPLGLMGAGTFDERGFLGVAFHPDYQKNRKLYTYTAEPVSGAPSLPTTVPAGSTPNHQNVIAEWQVTDVANPAAGVMMASRREIWRVDHPQFNHNGGDIVFGPDGKLYVPVGDGGGSDDQDGDLSLGEPAVFGHSGDGNAQKLTNPLGKIHRIDVDGNNASNGQYGIPADNPFVGMAGATKEIWAYGLRNPWRLSFDTQTGALIAGDIGQNDIEEVDLIVKGGNYGWSLKEGTLCFDGKGPMPGVATTTCPPNLPAGLIEPLAQFDTHHEGHSVVGGFVYRGSKIPELKGRYVFGEWSRLFDFPAGPDNYGRLFYLPAVDLRNSTKLQEIQEFNNFAEQAASLGLTDDTRPAKVFKQSLSVLGMGEDASGEIYVLGNRTGRPFGTDGILVRLTRVGGDAPPPSKGCSFSGF
jgi:glucose/arabinose dehydrogenase